MSLFRRTRDERVPTCVLRLLICAACVLAIASPARAAEKPRIEVNDYVIDADLAPKTHHLTAKADRKSVV